MNLEKKHERFRINCIAAARSVTLKCVCWKNEGFTLRVFSPKVRNFSST